jgi:hypothetical protein
MRATAILSLVLAIGCGSPKDRGACRDSTECAAGTYCARTPDGGVCWADSVSPVVSSVTVHCGPPCRRDGTLVVTAAITDDHEVLGADAIVGLATTVVVPLAWDGIGWSADVQLARYPFPEFERGVHVTVNTRDGARNTATLDAAGVTTVTRLRFQRPLAPGIALGSPAVMSDGTVVVASGNRAYFVSWDGDSVASTVVGASSITAAPLVQGSSVWIGSGDHNVCELRENAGVWSSSPRADTQTAIAAWLATTGDGHVLAATATGFVYAVTSVAQSSGAQITTTPFGLGPVTESTNDSIFAVASGSVFKLRLAGGATQVDNTFASGIGFKVESPPAFDAGLVVAVSNGTVGLLKRVGTSGGDPQQLATTAEPSGGPAIQRDGSILVPETTRTLSRWTSSGAQFPGWSTPDLLGLPTTPLILNGRWPFVVSTSTGTVNALNADGTIGWSKSITSSPLQPGNIYTPPPAQQVPGTTLSTAYFAGADGYLHAVIVDGALDGSAPWPKAFHDPRNTNRAGPQP